MVVITRLKTRYLRWEDRAGRHFHRWPMGRRWAVLVLLPALLLTCGGTVIGGPLAWITGQTIEAGKGASDPQAAVNIYLLALGYNNPDGLLPIVGNSRPLMNQWRAYRADMERGDSAPSKLEFSFGPTAKHEDHAEVDADVYGVWWKNTNGRLDGYTSSAHRWQFTLHNDDGWRIDSVEPYDWCGGYIRADLCT